MSRTPRCVVDTNVIISAALFAGSTPYQVLELLLAEGLFLASTETMAELERQLRRAKFDRYTSQQDREALLAVIRSNTAEVLIAEQIAACRDPKDDKFLEVAVAGQADAIITGDEDLLVLHPFREISILTPATFLAGR